MFSLHNVYTKANTTIKVRYEDNEIEFILSSLISKRNKDELNENIQFTLLNEYVKYKGEEFKKRLFDILYQANNDAYDTITNPDIYPLPVHLVNPILDLLDFNDVYIFIKDVFKLKPPSNLPDKFDEKIESDARGSRVQTYLKNDYLELATLSTIIKVAMLPLYTFAYSKPKELNTSHREYILFHLIKQHKIYNTAPMVKLLGFMEKLIEQNTTSAIEADAIRVLERQIPKDELPVYMLAIVTIQKLSIAPLIDDTADKSIINKIYIYVNNKLKSNGDISKQIKDKTPLKDTESGTGDQESMIESYRIIHDLSSGTIVEMNWAVDSIEKILRQLPLSQRKFINDEIIKDSAEFCKQMLNGEIEKSQIAILSFIFKTIIDPRALDHIKIESLVNMFSVAFSYLWGLGCKHLACLLCSIVDKNTSDEIIINLTFNKTRIPKELKEQLDFYYPYRRIINDETTANVAEESINEISNEIFSNNWIPLAYDKYLNDAIGEYSASKLVSPDLKVLLTEFIIKNEELVNV